MTIKKLDRAQVKKAKHDLAVLKRAGLYKGDVRKKPTEYGLKQIRKFSDVLSGKAKAVTVPRRKYAREFNEVYKTKYRKVVVPVKKGEKVFYSAKRGELFSYRQEFGHTTRRIFPKKNVNSGDLKNLPRGPNIRYAIPVGTGGGMERMTYDELVQFANKYQKSSAWKAYLEIHEIVDGEHYEPEEE